MDENRKNILIEYYQRYRKLGKTDEQISDYLIHNKFATQSDINEILPKPVKKEIPYILISIIGVPLVIVFILVILIFTIGGSSSKPEPVQTYFDNFDEIDAYEEESYNSFDDEEVVEESIQEEEEETIIKEEPEPIEEEEIIEEENITQEDNVVGDNESIDISKLDDENPVKIDLSKVELVLTKKSLENVTLEMEFEIKGYIVQFEDEVSVLHSTSGLDFLYEEGIDEVEIEDMLNSGEITDNTYLVNGDNYYRLALYVDVYDKYIYSDALNIEFGGINENELNTGPINLEMTFPKDTYLKSEQVLGTRIINHNSTYFEGIVFMKYEVEYNEEVNSSPFIASVGDKREIYKSEYIIIENNQIIVRGVTDKDFKTDFKGKFIYDSADLTCEDDITPYPQGSVDMSTLNKGIYSFTLSIYDCDEIKDKLNLENCKDATFVTPDTCYWDKIKKLAMPIDSIKKTITVE